MNIPQPNSKLLSALVKATVKMTSVPMDAVNPQFKSKYASLESVLKVLKPVLSKHGLGFSQCPFDAFKLETIVYHESGEQMGWIMEMKPTKDSPQGVGSNITYMRRYMLVSIFGLVGDPDDDGNEASAPPPRPQQPTASQAIQTAAVRNGWTASDVARLIHKLYGADSLERLGRPEQEETFKLVSTTKPTEALK